ncbi:Bile acid 7-dehydroxylase 1/3 [Pelagimonas phthalicica]|uniref:Bile acid 7-dehydroxylase 1/3 n=1 Tax=Pelagimonas phthalicica TaxID=1037362 RepID=A0A238JEV1_9RHOB|nr:SDR family NAD(P)-dependent oxidoreductase [Pelagimonas phthalicica]TDS92152.1 NAD(P)-dependent dehydrogenase (short-subunit alcohol dehydrogenase family) [Pelagimonas phthalicica]SMX29211.1 Bile acid 7-dehydroxylase 1/3 [Pelagimonas phthalicica]
MILVRETPAIVTGGASGLGAAVSSALRAKNVPVAILDMNAETGRAFAKAIGGQFAECDISDATAVTSALEELRGIRGQERICADCAGIAPAAKTISRGASHDAQLYAKAIRANLMGTFNVATQSALGMSTADALNADGERGVIINTASIAAYEGQMGQLAYASSKAGVVGLMLPMARDLAKSGIRIAAIAPGIFATPMVTGFPQEV